MSLFKKKTCCCKGSGEGKYSTQKFGEITSIKVLGAGCKSCHDQYEYAKEAVKNLGLSVEVEYITDLSKVVKYGVMSMPAIVVNERVASMGKVLKSAEVEALLKKVQD